MAPSGTRTVVNMRQDLLSLVQSNAVLKEVDEDFQHLLTSWFNPGFLQLKHIDWTTPAHILEKLIEYEAVHEMQGWEDLRRRLDANDRRCFGFFHPALPDEPLIFVEVALVEGVASSVQVILAPRDTQIPAEEHDTAIFYSISNCQEGLRGISFGNFLIKHVVMLLKEELPELNNFATLSPIPGFMRWLEGLEAPPAGLVSTEEFDSLRAAWVEQGWLGEDDEKNGSSRKSMLLRLCAHYLLNEKRGASPLDPVARFHLGNGASVDRINWQGDVSANGLKQSAGLLVNYRYDLNAVEENHERFFNSGDVVASPSVTKMLSRN